jgi:hypothetical protein
MKGQGLIPRLRPSSYVSPLEVVYYPLKYIPCMMPCLRGAVRQESDSGRITATICVNMRNRTGLDKLHNFASPPAYRQAGVSHDASDRQLSNLQI